MVLFVLESCCQFKLQFLQSVLFIKAKACVMCYMFGHVFTSLVPLTKKIKENDDLKLEREHSDNACLLQSKGLLMS